MQNCPGSLGINDEDTSKTSNESWPNSIIQTIRSYETVSYIYFQSKIRLFFLPVLSMFLLSSFFWLFLTVMNP